jgi:hypothetical protein
MTSPKPPTDGYLCTHCGTEITVPRENLTLIVMGNGFLLIGCGVILIMMVVSSVAGIGGALAEGLGVVTSLGLIPKSQLSSPNHGGGLQLFWPLSIMCGGACLLVVGLAWRRLVGPFACTVCHPRIFRTLRELRRFFSSPLLLVALFFIVVLLTVWALIVADRKM